MQTDERCGICVYHKLTPVGAVGKCRRFPPVPMYGAVNTGPAEWCGEFKEDKDKLQKLTVKQEKK